MRNLACFVIVTPICWIAYSVASFLPEQYDAADYLTLLSTRINPPRKWDPEREFADAVMDIRANPNNADAFARRSAYYHYEKKDFLKAISDLTKAINLANTDHAAIDWHFQRGNLFADQGKLNEALRDFTAAIEQSPVPEYFGARACTRLRLGEFDMALNDCGKSFSRFSGPSPYLAKISALRELGRESEADTVCQSVIARYILPDYGPLTPTQMKEIATEIFEKAEKVRRGDSRNMRDIYDDLRTIQQRKNSQR